MKKVIKILSIILLMSFVMTSCEKGEITETDNLLYNELVNSEFVYSIFTPGIVKGLGNSPRGWEKLKFNKIAYEALDLNGRLPTGGEFPEGSLIVKEAYSDSNGVLIEYAIMKKDSKNKFARKDWLWSEITVDGTISYPVSNKGQSCINCHTKPFNIDATRTFNLR
jgi:hypothetical protein